MMLCACALDSSAGCEECPSSRRHRNLAASYVGELEGSAACCSELGGSSSRQHFDPAVAYFGGLKRSAGCSLSRLRACTSDRCGESWVRPCSSIWGRPECDRVHALKIRARDASSVRRRDGTMFWLHRTREGSGVPPPAPLDWMSLRADDTPIRLRRTLKGSSGLLAALYGGTVFA